MMLNNYVRDFKALIDWIQLQEKLEKTDAQNRRVFFVCFFILFYLPLISVLICFQVSLNPSAKLFSAMRREVWVSALWL